MKRAARHLYAVVRVPNVECIPWEGNNVTVKEVLFTQEAAEAEVQRLNALNGEKGYVYFWTITRLVQSAEDDPASP